MDYPDTVAKIHQFVQLGIVPGVSYAIVDDDGIQADVFGQQELVPVQIATSQWGTVRPCVFDQGCWNNQPDFKATCIRQNLFKRLF